MSELFAATGILIIAAITPGPNNIFVMTAAIQRGVLHALQTILAIIFGSLVLLLLVRLGLGTLTEQWSLVTPSIALLGSSYLGFLGFKLLNSQAETGDGDVDTLHSSFVNLAVFQLINPKSWVLVTIFLAAGERASLASLAAILIVVTFGSLLIWAAAGVSISRIYKTKTGRMWTDRLMGFALIAFAALLALQTIS